MNLDEEIFKSLHEDLEICRDYIREISQGMMKANISKYPVFVATRGENDIDLGLPIISRTDFDISWNFSASHLEDLVNKNIVVKEKVEEFRKTFKNPNEFMCIFVAEENSASFVFMPFDRHRENLN